MKKKNILTIALSLCLAAVIAVGATLAYFTDDTDKMSNVVTTGNVKIKLNDTTPAHTGEDGQEWKVGTVTYVDPEDPDSAQTGISYEELMPGDTISKLVSVEKLSTSQDCYVAIRVDVVDVASKKAITEAQKKEIMNAVKETATLNDWEYYTVDDAGTSMIFYCTTKLDDAVSSKELFDSVKIPTTWGNNVVDATFAIDVKAAAVQKANLDAPAMVPVEEGSAVLEPNTSLEQLIALLTAVDTGDGE